MSSVKGVVQKTFAKPFGDKTLHSFTLQGNQTFYGTGERRLVEEGKAYEFMTRTAPSGRISVENGTLRPWDAPAGAIQAPPVQNFSGGTPYKRAFQKDEGKDSYWKGKEDRDVRNDSLRELGATRNTAISLMTLMLANGAVKLPAKESAKEQALYELFEHYTELLMKGREVDAEETEADSSAAAVDVPPTEDTSWK